MRFVLGFAALLLCGAAASAAPNPPGASGIVWRVYNPFRFFKHDDAFLRHKSAYDAVLQANGGKAPPDLIERMEGLLNAPHCPDASNFDQCRRTWDPHFDFDKERLGWASKSLGVDETCYGHGADGAYRYGATCRRDAAAGQARDEDYVNPSFHAVEARLGAPLVSAHAGQNCQWRFTPAGGAASPPHSASCADAYVVQDVPAAGGLVEALDGSGHALAQETVVVMDWLVVGLGDSYASGEGNPDRPVALAPWAKIDFDFDWHNDVGLPIRATQDSMAFDSAGRIAPRPLADEYYAARAQWTSPDCHRSQYSYQFRVALQLAIENPHRAVTLIHLACSGADALQGVFQSMQARELNTSADGRVAAQFDVLLDLLCASPRSGAFVYTLPYPQVWGAAALDQAPGTIASCKVLKRPIDLALLSLGGNDVGFSGLVAYGISSSAGAIADTAELAQLFGLDPIRFRPVWSYLGMLRTRLQTTATALSSLLQLAPSSVVQTDYEDLVVDEHGATCNGAIGLDGITGLAFDVGRTREVETFAIGDKKLGRPGLFDTLRCSANTAGCGPGWGNPTGFKFITTQTAFANRGVCAMKNPAERAASVVPRNLATGFANYVPTNFLPYVSRQRLFVSFNDALMKANTQIDWPDCPIGSLCPPAEDRVQLVSSGFYGGSFHRTAEGHAVVADQVMGQAVRAMFAGR